MSSGPAGDDTWLRQPLTNAEEVARRYDDWVSTYDAELVRDWRYDAPEVAAQLLVASGAAGPILDVGCGTGLVGRALRARGVTDIAGVDLSPKSLEASATTLAYSSLQLHDFNAELLPFESGSFGGVICVGVLSYAHDAAAVVTDFIRVARPGGVIVFTHRVDLWDQSLFGDQLLAMSERGLLRSISWTEPKDYMPGAPDVSDLQIRYVTAVAT